jgi:hypothetical protein
MALEVAVVLGRVASLPTNAQRSSIVDAMKSRRKLHGPYLDKQVNKRGGLPTPITDHDARVESSAEILQAEAGRCRVAMRQS